MDVEELVRGHACDAILAMSTATVATELLDKFGWMIEGTTGRAQEIIERATGTSPMVQPWLPWHS